MKRLIIIALIALSFTGSQAEITRSVNAVGNTLWFRNGAVKLIRYKESRSDLTTYLVSHKDLKDSKPTYTVPVIRGEIGEINPWSGAEGCAYLLHDLDKNGAKEVFEIVNDKTKETLDGYMLIKGALEPIPDFTIIKKPGSITKIDYQALAAYITEENKTEPNQP
ncbi:MAG TPA: hypothetical protein VK958_09605 [Methylophilus sp.]|uniref:hypothetical protein n=1 Tax=Methylophilus sp. TaxID=29541 RepID=UPI002BE3A44E|nr:hypothetical protein [Methylophilus sp.]HSH87489.1 hypothetical protein [Methylophilus sp.]